MSTTIWAYASVEHLSPGAVVTDKRGNTAIHLGKGRWMMRYPTDPGVTVCADTRLLQLPVTLHPAWKETTQ